jgi:hypothetical protein
MCCCYFRAFKSWLQIGLLRAKWPRVGQNSMDIVTIINPAATAWSRKKVGVK